MKRVLITGITGFVGANLVRYFHGNKEIKIIGHSRNVQHARDKFDGFSIDFISELTSEKFNEHKVDAILHLAGIAHDLSGKIQLADYHEVNYKMTIELFNEFKKSTATKFIFTSSVKAVTDRSDSIIDEEYEAEPTSTYGKSKREAEKYILKHANGNKRIFILRPVMIHGPGNKGNLNLLYKFVRSGLPYPLGAFENKRSFLAIDNFCFVIEKILYNSIEEGTYLLADSEPISTNELVILLSESVERKIYMLRFPKRFVKSIAKIGTWLNAPFNEETLVKLCDNMVVSNKKLLLNLGEELPVESRAGLLKTAKSFDG